MRPRPAEGLALRQELDEGRVERRDHLDEESRLDDRVQALDPFGRVRFRHLGLHVAGPTLAVQDHVLGPLGRLELRVLLVDLKQQPCKNASVEQNQQLLQNCSN